MARRSRLCGVPIHDAPSGRGCRLPLHVERQPIAGKLLTLITELQPLLVNTATEYPTLWRPVL